MSLLRKVQSRATRWVREALGWHSAYFFRATGAKGAALGGELLECDDARAHEWGDTLAALYGGADAVAARRRNGHRLFTLTADRTPLCFGWVSEVARFRVSEIAADVETRERCVLIWNCITPESLRGRGYYTEFLKALRVSPILDGKRLVIYCDTRNVPSGRGILAAGFDRWATIRRSRLGTRIDAEHPEELKVIEVG